MQNLKAIKSSFAAHPVALFLGSWTFVFFLYSLHLSGQLIYDAADFFYLYVLIVGGFLAGYWYVACLLYYLSRGDTSRFFLRSRQKRLALEIPEDRDVLWHRTKTLFKLWAVLTIVEVVVSGGIPLLWIFSGSGKNYRDFGIQSLHGFLMSMLLSCSTVSFYIYLLSKRRRYTLLPCLTLIWLIASVTRGFFLGIIVQMLLLVLSTRRLNVAQIRNVVLGFVFLVVIFGIVGDLRSGGGDLIRAVGQPTERFPEWLPTGFLWAYIYLATPVNNLFNTIQLIPSVDGFSAAATTSQLFPSFIRDLIFPASSLMQGNLVDPHLNVSTGFIGPFLDMGLLGIAAFSFFLGLTAKLFWSLRRDAFFLLGYSFVAQALIFSIFYDVMLYLPYLFQLFWFWCLLRPKKVAVQLSTATAA
jgi:oligosaccharide repeat unit polymerase